ncbi:MAG TPA: hypothetical protein PLZ21_04285, partial [Armatimonadota bacterium]|nr:hypothetical protein [Armatimonadota bacterium]
CSNGERWNGYMLCYSFTSNCAYLEGDGRFIGDIVAFVEGKGFTNPGELPDYNPEHYYQFVIFVGDSPKYITLGTGDGGVWDNYGGIDVVLQQVAPVPEPSSIFVLLCGLGGVSCIVRAGRSRNTFN